MINDFKHDEPLVISLYITFKYLSKYTLIFFFKRTYTFGINTPPPLYAPVRF